MVNDVVLNQVLVRLDDAATTDALVAQVQADRPDLVRRNAVARRAGDADQRVVVEVQPADAEAVAGVILECAERARAAAR